MTEYLKNIEELKKKIQDKMKESQQALFARDIKKHQECLFELIELDSEFTELLGGIQCPEPLDD